MSFLHILLLTLAIGSAITNLPAAARSKRSIPSQVKSTSETKQQKQPRIKKQKPSPDQSSLNKNSNDNRLMQLCAAAKLVGMSSTELFWLIISAIQEDDDQALRLILTLDNVNLNLFDSAGRSPLHWAAQLTNITCARLLLEHGANPQAQDSAGRTPLDIAYQETSTSSNHQQALACYRCIRTFAKT